MMKQIYQYAYFPLVAFVWLLGLFGKLPRVLPSTKGEGHERRYFYGSVWAVGTRPTRVGPALGVPAKKSHHQRHQAGGVSRDPGVHR